VSLERPGADAFELEVDEEVAHQRQFALTSVRIHAIVWASVNAFLVLTWALTGHGYPWFLWPMASWGIPLAIHAGVASQPVDRVQVRRRLEKRQYELEEAALARDHDEDSDDGFDDD
jgi:hypothetical protein